MLSPITAELQPLATGHGPAILAFEIVNRSYFSATVSDRGDEYFATFADRLEEALADQAADRAAYFVLVEPDGSVVGRFNLYGIVDGSAELGYRVAERVAGRGVATAAVRELCRWAAEDRGLTRLVARTSVDHRASQRVLLAAGFVIEGPTDIDGRSAIAFRRDLAGRDGPDGARRP